VLTPINQPLPDRGVKSGGHAPTLNQRGQPKQRSGCTSSGPTKTGDRTMSNTIQKAIEIFRAKLPEAKGKFSAFTNEHNANLVDIFSESGLYCTVNVKSATVKGV